MTAALAPAANELAEARDLMAAATRGDRDAFGEIYRRHHPFILRYIHTRVGSPQIAEDLAADTFLRALARIETFTWQDRDPRAWLVTIAHNLVADHFKRHDTRLVVRGATTETVYEAAKQHRTSPHGNPEADTASYLAARALLEALQLLTSDQRQCVILRAVRGLSVAETAHEMNRNEGAVKTLMCRAHRALTKLGAREALR